MRVFLNLCAGLDRIGVAYRVNDYRYARANPKERVCIIGKPHVLGKVTWRNPILFGAAVYSHPCEDPDLMRRLPVERVLVPGEWMRSMCLPVWGDAVVAWPVGIDTKHWRPDPNTAKEFDFLIYDKVRWDHDRFEESLIQPIRDELTSRNQSFTEIRYGYYREDDFHELLQRCRAMIFLCEHETQGIAYQQALSCGVPILAWDRGGYWQDPSYYPHKVQFEPVSSVPYWDDRCGMKFANASEFLEKLETFWQEVKADRFLPRDYILDNLTLEKCAQQYVNIATSMVEA